MLPVATLLASLNKTLLFERQTLPFVVNETVGRGSTIAATVEVPEHPLEAVAVSVTLKVPAEEYE